jgi:threonine synthase
MVRSKRCDFKAMSVSEAFLTHFDCSETGERLPADALHNLSSAGAPLLARYDMGRISETVSPEDIAARPQSMWRYAELLPHCGLAEPVSLGEAMTPLVPLKNLAPKGGRLLVKDEGRMPTGSFKARGLAMAVTMAKHFGVKRMALPTNGNAGAALAAYANRAGIESFIFCPGETPAINMHETLVSGGNIWRVNGQIHECGRIVAEGKETVGWHDVSTLKEPYRLEGKKTMGFEIAEQMGWELPDAIFYPTGGGTGLIGMWKAFEELAALGWIGRLLPRMVCVQSTGCAPIVRAWEEGREEAETWENPRTMVNGVRVPVAFADRLMLRTIAESKGFGVAVSDEEVMTARDEIVRAEGMLLCPEGAACYAAWQRARCEGRIGSGDRVVLFNTQTALKADMKGDIPRLDISKPIDYQAMLSA